MQFDFTNTNIQDVSLPISPGSATIPGDGAVQTLTNQPQTTVSAAATAASSLASRGQSAVSSATNSVETAADALLPQNCSLDIKYFCVDHIGCKDLPLNVSNALPPTVNQLINTQILGSILESVTGIEGYIIVGLNFTILAFLSGIISICYIWKHQLELIYPLWGWQIPLLAASASCISLLAPTIMVCILLSNTQQLPKEINVVRGAVIRHLVEALACAIIIGLCTVLASTLD
jgi:hypothetical protein